MPKRLLTLFLILTGLFLSGWKSKNSLELENILQYQKERQEKLKASAQEPKPASIPAVAVSPSTTPAETTPAIPPVISNIATHPPELKFFILPEDFKILDETARRTFRMEDEGKNPSNATAIWRLSGKDFTILATKLPPKITNWDSYTPQIFESNLHNMAFETSQYYDVNYRSAANHKIRKIGGIYYLKISTFYLLNTEWRGDIHYFFFYTPEYTLNILLTGFLPEVVQKDIELQKTILDFTEHLKATFPAGLPLKVEPADAPAPVKATT